MFLHGNNHNYNSYRFIQKSAFILILNPLTNQKQESGFQQDDGLVTGNIYSPSTLKPCRIQQTFIKESSYMLFLFVLQFHARTLATQLKKLPKLHRKKSNKWPMVSFIHNGSELIMNGAQFQNQKSKIQNPFSR